MPVNSLVGNADELGGMVRRLIGELADDRGVYYKFADVEAPGDPFVGQSILSGARGFTQPPPGSESGMLQPFELIRRAAYPDDLAGQAVKRLLDSPLQSRYGPNHIPVLVRPSGSVSTGGDAGRHVVAYDDATGRRAQAIDIAGGSQSPLVTLIHEARHATEHPDNDMLRALRSVTAQSPVADGLRLKGSAKNYYARPSEMLAYLAEAGDDFVRDRGRLVETVRDANAVMERVEAGESLGRLHPLVRQMYSGAYKQSPVARQHINSILTKYFAVPGAVPVGAASQGQE